MNTYPDFSDLGTVGGSVRSAWEYHITKLQEYFYYIDGEVFQEKIPVNVPNGEDAPLLYPAGHEPDQDAVHGPGRQHVRRVDGPDHQVRRPRRRRSGRKLQEGHSLARRHYDGLFREFAFLGAGIYPQAFRGAALKVTPTLTYPYIKWSMPPVESFLPIWNAENQDKLLEVYVVYDITSDQARLMYGFDGTQDLVRRVEKWTPRYYENYLNGKLIEPVWPEPVGKNPVDLHPPRANNRLVWRCPDRRNHPRSERAQRPAGRRGRSDQLQRPSCPVGRQSTQILQRQKLPARSQFFVGSGQDHRQLPSPAGRHVGGQGSGQRRRDELHQVHVRLEPHQCQHSPNCLWRG